MKKYHIQAKQLWSNFTYDGTEYCLKHLNTHEVTFKGNKYDYSFIVSYGLHCFTKNDQDHSITTTYDDEFEARQINLERYHLSKFLRGFIEDLDSHKLIYETTKEKYFTFEHTNNLTGKIEKCKVCLCIFKENRLLRIHVTSAFFDRESKELNRKGVTIFKIAMDTQRKPKKQEVPKEASRK